MRAPTAPPSRTPRVTVEQTRHQFGFGNIGFDFVALANGEGDDPAPVIRRGLRRRRKGLAPLWLELFNMATLPFYWRGFEPERGQPDTARLLAAARWFASAA